MLKKFLKFLKGTSRDQDFDGSYLDHLLAQVRPRVEAQLERCPEHDPLLLVVTEILRLTDPEQWSDEIDCPLSDDQSPALAAPAPPAPPVESAEPADQTSDGFEIVEASEVTDDEEVAAGENQPDETQPDETQPDVSALEAELGEADGVQFDASLADADLTSDDLTSAAAESTRPDAEPRRLDTPEVLQAGRIFLGLLIENDRLPVDMQLSVAETMLARDLLLGYFVGDDQFEARAQELLSLVEQKFNEGAFSQARILLQLFQTDRPTRVNNDRNLFYEDMILRLGIRRRHLVEQSVLSEFDAHSNADDLDARLADTAGWLQSTLHVEFHLFTRQPADVATWGDLAKMSRREGADDVFLRYIPPKRWRPLRAAPSSGAPSSGAQSPTERMLAHVSAATVKRYIVRQLKTCYFVLRAVGDTGLESFLDVYFDWTEEKFGFNSVRLMPLVYRRTMSDTQLIDKIFEEAFRRFFQKKAAEYLADFDDEAILEATAQTLDALGGMDFNQIPPGDYDLGGLVLDRLFGLEYHHPEFAFKLHRLT